MDGTMLLSSMTQEPVESGPGSTVIRLTPGGDPPHAALVDAVIDRWQFGDEVAHMTDSDKEDELRARADEKVTVITWGENMFGARMIKAHEGRVKDVGGRLAWMPKGARTRGFYLNAGKVLAWYDGWNTDLAAEGNRIVTEFFPKLEPLTLDDLLALPSSSDERNHPKLAVFGTNPIFEAPSCVWLIGSYDPDDDIVDDSVLLIDSRFGVSEHGSSYGQQLLRFPVGVITGWKGCTFREALRLCDVSHEEALRTVFANV